MFKEIADALKFDYEMFEAEDGYFGSLNEDGTWNGAIHELIEKVEHIIPTVWFWFGFWFS